MDIVAPASDDRLATLPDEILEMILGCVVDSTDMASVSRASRVCERILHPARTTWLFHEILPHISTHLPKQDLLNCRATCSKWRKSIDSHLENSADLHRKFSFSPSSAPAITGFGFAMKAHPGNPFPARAVDFRMVTDIRFTTGYWNHVFLFLNQFGEHIWTCSFNFSNARCDHFVIILRQCLAHLKNVRRLNIKWKFDPSLVPEDKMKLDLENPRFPRLVHLEHMELTGVFSRVFYQKVVIPVYSDQLKTLKVDGIFP